MKLIVIPGFLGYAEEEQYLDLGERFALIGIDLEVVKSPELESGNYHEYKLSLVFDELMRLVRREATDDICLLGVSAGGPLVIKAASIVNVSSLVTVVSPFSFGVGDDISEIAQAWEMEGKRKFVSSKYGEVFLPYSFLEDARTFNALELIGKVACPKLLLAGKNDERVPLSLTKKLYDQAVEPKTFKAIKDMRHNYKRQPEIMKLVNDYILEFIGD